MGMKRFSLRLEEWMLLQIHYIAEYGGRSINRQIVWLIQQNIQAFEKNHGLISKEELLNWQKHGRK